MKIKAALPSKSSLKKERSIKDIREFIARRSEIGKQKVANNSANPEVDGQVVWDKETIGQAIKDRICGYGSKPYSDQIALKKEKLHGYLVEIKKLAKEKLRPDEISTMNWLSSSSDVCCPLKDFIECDESSRLEYRTKSEFTIGISCLEKLPTVGFNISDHKKQFHSIELTDSAEEIMTIPKESFAVAKLTQSIIRSLDWPVYDRATHKGFWRFLVVRLSKNTGELVINLVGNQEYFESREKFAHEFKTQFIDRLVADIAASPAFKSASVKSITFQHAATSNDCIPYIEDKDLDLFFGASKTYHEKISGCTFEVSNSSFLQINVAQSEKMYEYARKYANLDKQTILLDICSGIGTIGVSVGKDCFKVIGIEMVKSSCENAIKNAASNGMQDKY